MIAPAPPDELVAHVAATTGLADSDAARVVADVVGYFGEDLHTFVRRRHRELRARGVHNDEAYRVIQAEVGRRRFAAAPLSERQVRRLVYG